MATVRVLPTSFTFNKEGGSANFTFINKPSGGLLTEYITPEVDWVSSISINNNVATITVKENTTGLRRAVIRFIDNKDDNNYTDLTIIQNSDGVDSIWVDKIFEPSSFQVGDNYHFMLQDHNTNKIIYEGITVPVSETEKPLGINIPRLVDSYIHSDELDDLKIDMKLRTLNGSLSVDFYNMNGDVPSIEKTFKYWNDWAGPGYNTGYYYTQSINDPINQ